MKKSPWLFLLCLSLSVSFIFYAGTPKGDSAQGSAARLFDPVGARRAPGAEQDRPLASPAGVREQEVRVNFEAVNFEAAAELSFPLFDGRTYRAERAAAEGYVEHTTGGLTWRGKIYGEGGWSGDVILSAMGKALSGIIYSPGGVYEIIPQAGARHVLVQIDQSQFPSCGGGVPAEPSELAAVTTDSPDNETLPTIDDGSQIDVMVVYTAPVRSFLGGTPQAEAFALQAVNSANTVYINSGITTRLRLVRAMEGSYSDPVDGSGSAGLNWVTNDAAVTAARHAAKADMVALITENATSLCGIAWLMTNVSSSFTSRAFSLTQRSCAVGNLTFAHELGHNQACDHNRENANDPSVLAYPYAFGYWNSTANFRTVMSYSNPCPSCQRVPYFSTPLRTHNGNVLGVAAGNPNAADNARVINNTALTISRFFDSAGGGAPINDNFANATAIANNTGGVVGTTIGATKEAGEPFHANNSGSASIWYSWQAPSTGDVTIITAGSSFDTLLGVYTGSSVTGLTHIASDDDDTDNNVLTSRVTFRANAGTTYRIAVDGWGNATGIVNLIWSNLSLAPANNNFAGAQVITGTAGSVAGSNAGANKEFGEPNHAGISGGSSVWYSWQAPASGVALIQTAGSSFDTLLGVYTGSSVTGLTHIASNDDDLVLGGLTSRVTFNATAGTTYRIAVDGYNNATGSIVLNWSLTGNSNSIVQFSATSHSVSESAGRVQVNVNRTGTISAPASVAYATANVTADRRTDYTQTLGTLDFAPNEAAKTITVYITDDVFPEPSEAFILVLSAPSGTTLGANSSATVAINDNDPALGPNPVDANSFNPQFFVRQHYVDFLNREPDAAGLAHWSAQTTGCGSPDPVVCRVNVSAAFFLSIEFQETGYLVYRMYKAAFGDTTSPGVEGTVPVIRLEEFLPDAQRIGRGVQVGVGNWFAQLEANKTGYALEFAQRQRFLNAFPASLSPSEFVDRLNQRAGGVLSAAERTQLINELTAAGNTTQGRAAVFRKVAEDADLRDAETRRAFVYMQYVGYMRRNPDDPQDTNFGGWKFWLDKLNLSGGDYVRAEMVKAFIESIEYKNRFGQ